MTEFDPKQDRVAIVTGAGTGIGQAIAARFGSLGWRVAVGGRRVELLAETASLVEEAGGTCLHHALDVTDPESVERFFATTEAELGPVTVVINNAATARYGPLDDFAPEEIEVEVATKLLGSLYMARRGIQAMRPQGRGDILFITSLAAVQPWPFHLPYAAANAGVEQAARSLRLELEGSGIRVTMLRCGETIGTDFSTRELETGRIGPATEHWFRRGLIRHTGLMTPDMVAEAVASAVTLPVGYQYETLAVVPTAPVGDLPVTFEEFGEAVMRAHMPT
ncbi:MAG: SDR family NAD(P)-dependent oxidoreductase [Acidimicrobiia bacterium]|jgi:NAD(P)-dependent dehydrogenase (short-subunit alcohol dehydrogenase family)